jgi:hypothetical protein
MNEKNEETHRLNVALCKTDWEKHNGLCPDVFEDEMWEDKIQILYPGDPNWKDPDQRISQGHMASIMSAFKDPGMAEAVRKALEDK